MSHSIDVVTHTHTSTYIYEYTHAHITPINTFERLSQLDIDIHEVGQRMPRC
jgi:hypothetical protein